jgi:hypothetical protein
MSEYNINQLGDVSKQILEVLRSFMKQVMEALNVLKRIPEMIANIRTDLNDGFSNLIQAQAEMEMYVRMAQLKSKKSLIFSENEAIDDFEKQLQEDFKEIDNRYSRINSELTEECKKRIREIDSHLLELPNRFPNQLFTTYQDEILPLFWNLVRDSSIAHKERLYVLKIAVEKSKRVLTNFIALRNDFFSQVKKYEIPQTIDVKATYHIPVWIIEMEKTNTRSGYTHIMLPGDLKTAENWHESDHLTEYTIDAKLARIQFIKESPEIQQKLMKSITWTNNPELKNKLRDNFIRYFEKLHAGKYSNAKNAVGKVIENSEIQFIR